MWAFPVHRDAAGAAGSLVKYEGYPSGGNSTLVYFTCTDCAIEAKRAAAQWRRHLQGQVLDRPVRLHRAGDRHGRQHDRAAFDAVNPQGNAMAVQLDHFIVPSHNRVAAAKLLGELLGVAWAESGAGPVLARIRERWADAGLRPGR